MEMERVPQAGYPIEGLWISGFTKDVKVLSLPFKIISSLRKARKILKAFQPDAVIGVGGFASGPTLKAANWLGIPTIIQEQNSYPGKTNRNLGAKAKAICVAYNGLDRWFPEMKIHFTGNPLRNQINGHCDRAESAAYFGVDPEKPIVLLVGGSQGALGINKGISAQIEKFKGSDMQLIWQTGKFYYDEAVKEVKEAHLEDHIKPTVFIDRMDYAYSAADVVISRAGAISISELALAQKPVIFVPLPTAAEDHQTKNAMQLVDAGAALMVYNNETELVLIPKLQELLRDKKKQEEMKANIAQFARPNAADDIVEIVLREARSKK
ncbi:MAG: UDP-N-acetylglucosamine--N-acetylmuramyl-(pentapeptide) pyrophosphoryl-undecaprenol N-acetylglucosamine transferase, partial [Bacteroidales bacterium]|nr:UDP-N-acetylglucosamine--N-acetylmuramyl-(pentapeptide) pyrophosphoryl-undecaprenol N-acetylglucosamine transferase [Bacteroidales bacterium]